MAGGGLFAIAMRSLIAPISVVLALGAAFGQTAGTPLSFEVASVKPASAPIATKDAYTEGYNAGMRAALAAQGLRIVGQRVTVTDNSLKDLIRLAYQVKDHQISGPAWMATEKYEIAATMPAGASRGQVPEMLQTLLAERFHLKLHREMRKMAVYALVAAKGGPKLTAAAGPASGRGGTGWTSSNAGRVLAKAASMAAFADLLSKAAGRPVIDMTRLTGLYDFDLTYTPELSATAADAGPTLATALLEQLGLKLEKREMQVEVLVIESADKVPTEN
jgi:uncharacterized protein (TIGR03435 family)